MSSNRFISPLSGLRGRLCNWIANWTTARRLRRTLTSRLPFPILASDVRDIIYANWIVRITDVAPMIPAGIKIIERDGYTILTVLTYRHGHFGPHASGALRRFFPSPLQNNWRLYVDGIVAGVPPRRRIVLFVKNIFDSALHTLGTRLFSDVLPSHHAGIFTHDCDSRKSTTIIDGLGSAPGLRLETRRSSASLPSDFQRFFASWDDAVAVLCLQDAAIAPIDDSNNLAYAEIDLPIDPAAIEPAEAVQFTAGALLNTFGATTPFCFRIPAVSFRVVSEAILP